jgi:hypothetical protein
VDRFQIGRNDHGCRLVWVEAHFNGICDMLGPGFRGFVLYTEKQADIYISLGIGSLALLN